MDAYEKAFALLRSLFPSDFHRYHLVEKEWGFVLETAHWSFYLLIFIISSAFIYLLLAWENSKWTNPLKVPFSWLVLVISIGVGLIFFTGGAFLIYGADINKVVINKKEQYIEVHSVLWKEKIPFAEIKKLELQTVYVTKYKSSSGQYDYYLMSGDKKVMMFQYNYRWSIEGTERHKEFIAYANKIVEALNLTLEK